MSRSSPWSAESETSGERAQRCRPTCSLPARRWRDAAGNSPACRGQRSWGWWRNDLPSGLAEGTRNGSWCRRSCPPSAGWCACDTSCLAPPSGEKKGINRLQMNRLCKHWVCLYHMGSSHSSSWFGNTEVEMSVHWALIVEDEYEESTVIRGYQSSAPCGCRNRWPGSPLCPRWAGLYGLSAGGISTPHPQSSSRQTHTRGRK